MGWWTLKIEKDKPGPRDTPMAMFPSDDDFEHIAKMIKEHYTSGNLPEPDELKEITIG